MGSRYGVYLVMVLCAWLGIGWARADYGEKIEFTSEWNGKKEAVYGYLSLPANVGKPVSAMVLVHGSGGLGVREARYVTEYNRMGIATFAVDSFTPRGVTSTVVDQSRVSTTQMVSDAYGALKLLSEHPRIDKHRIGVQGGSKGGQVALDAAMEFSARLRGIPADLKFAAHIPLYPGCTAQYRQPKTRGAPILMLLGGRDDYVGSAPCLDYAAAIKKAGASIDVIVYPNAEHGFDGRDGEGHYWIANAQNFSKCVVYIETDGKMTYAKTGETLETPAKAMNVLLKDCVTRGASVGTDPAAKSKSLDDMRAFFKRTLLQE